MEPASLRRSRERDSCVPREGSPASSLAARDLRCRGAPALSAAGLQGHGGEQALLLALRSSGTSPSREDTADCYQV